MVVLFRLSITVDGDKDDSQGGSAQRKNVAKTDVPAL